MTRANTMTQPQTKHVPHVPAPENRLTSHVFEGAASGPHLLILGAIHGDEACGTIALNAMMRLIEGRKVSLAKGRLTVVPLCNPLAAQKPARYVSHNLNRIIGHYGGRDVPITPEHSFADQVAGFIDGADMLLDIHSFHTDGPPFVFEDYDTPAVRELANATGLRDIVAGWPALYGAATENDTVGYACARQKPAVLVECGQHNDPESVGVAFRVIQNVLVTLGLIDGPVIDFAETNRRIKVQDMVIKTAPGKFTKPYIHLTPIEKGEVIAVYDSGETVTATYDGFIIMPGHQAAVGDEWFYTGMVAD